MEAEKQWDMDGETQRNNEAKDPKEQNPYIEHIQQKMSNEKEKKREDPKKKTSAKKQVSQTIQQA